MKIFDKIVDYLGNKLINAHTDRPSDNARGTALVNKEYVDDFDTMRDSHTVQEQLMIPGNPIGTATHDIGGLPAGQDVAGRKVRDVLEEIVYGDAGINNRYKGPSIMKVERVDNKILARGINQTIEIEYQLDWGDMPGITLFKYTAGHLPEVTVPFPGESGVLTPLTVAVHPTFETEQIVITVLFAPITTQKLDYYGNPIPIPDELAVPIELSFIIRYSSVLPVLMDIKPVGAEPDYQDGISIKNLVENLNLQYGVNEKWEAPKTLSKIPFLFTLLTPQTIHFYVPFGTALTNHFLSINEATDISAALEDDWNTIQLSTGTDDYSQNNQYLYKILKFTTGDVGFTSNQVFSIARYNE